MASTTTMQDAFEADLEGVETEVPCTFWFNGRQMAGWKDSDQETIEMRDAGWNPSFSTTVHVRASLFGAEPEANSKLAILKPTKQVGIVKSVERSPDGAMLSFKIEDLNAITMVEQTADGLMITTEDGKTISLQ